MDDKSQSDAAKEFRKNHFGSVISTPTSRLQENEMALSPMENAAAMGFATIACSAVAAGFVLAAPIAAAYLAPIAAGYVRRQGDNSQDFYGVERGSIRHKLNDKVRNVGNNINLVFGKYRSYGGFRYGLGDLLTEQITPARAGTIAGAAAGAYPAIDMLAFTDSMLLNSAIVYSSWPVWGITSGLGALAGYLIGEIVQTQGAKLASRVENKQSETSR